MIDGRALLRHQLAGLAFRFAHVLRDAPAGFASFEPGHGVRAPLAIVRHIADVLELGRWYLADEARSAGRPSDTGPRAEAAEPNVPDAWAEAIEAVYARLETLDALVADPQAVRDDDRLRSFVHGPLTDAATHVGQLATLRRLSGDAVAPVGYLEADVRAGRIRPSAEDDA